jgi:Regulator of ribonuclease activity B
VSLIGRLLGRQRSRWLESWQTFPGMAGDAPALWSVDLGAVDAAPVSSLPFRVDVIAPYQAGSDGLPIGHRGEADDAIRAAVEALGGAFLGWVAGQGLCRYTAHLPAPPPADVGADLPGAEVLVEYDPHWAYVRDTLAPDVRQHRLLADRDALALLAAEGDQLDAARAVAHVAVFADETRAEQAASALRADGFSVTVEPDGEGDFALTAVRNDPVAPPRVHDLSWAVHEIVERHDGTYDGWTCAVAA